MSPTVQPPETDTMPWPSVADGVIATANGLRIEFSDPAASPGGSEQFMRSSGELAMARLPSWPNNLFFDSVYEWTDERGRLAHCTYQEAWYASFQRLMRSWQ